MTSTTFSVAVLLGFVSISAIKISSDFKPSLPSVSGSRPKLPLLKSFYVLTHNFPPIKSIHHTHLKDIPEQPM